MVTWPCDIAVSHHVTVWHCNIASRDRATLQCHMVTWSRDNATLQCYTVDCQHVHYSIMMNVTWQRFDQSVKQLTVGHATNATDCMSLTGWILVPVILSVTWKALALQRSLLVGYPITVDEMDRTIMLDSSAVLSGDWINGRNLWSFDFCTETELFSDVKLTEQIAANVAHWTSDTLFLILVIVTYIHMILPSVLWRCRLGGRKGIRPVKNTLSGGVLAWLSVWSEMLAYGPADATATHCLLL